MDLLNDMGMAFLIQYVLSLQKHSKGQTLMGMVCEHLNLLERDYYGLTFSDTDTQKVSGENMLRYCSPNPKGK